MRNTLALVALLACGKANQEGSGGTVVQSRVLEGATFALPQGWTSSYGTDDTWRFASPDARTTVLFERTDERYIASPDAFMQHVALRYKGKLVTIEQREHAGKGFAITLAIFAGEHDPHPQRTTFVVRPLGKAWFSCHADGLDDEALRNDVIALCRSVRA